MNLNPPYKIKTIEPIGLLTREQRLDQLQSAGYNPFSLPEHAISVDLLTDSGTGALSKNQKSAMEEASRAYDGSPSFERLKSSIYDTFGFEYVIPVQQGRGAEHVVDFVMVKKGSLVPGNAHFDTTKANIEIMGGQAVNCTIDKAYDIFSDHPFKGNIDLSKLEKVIKKHVNEIPYVLHTVTCNQVGGQPVSMENIAEVSLLCQKYGVLFFLDGARFAENAFFIKERELKYRNHCIGMIVLEMMSWADGLLMSGKKDCLSPGGGFIALRDRKLCEKLVPYSIAFVGGKGYGGMTGETMEAFAVGMKEGIEENGLAYRISQVRYLGEKLKKIGVPFISPVGGHAIFVDAGKWLPYIPWDQFPGHSLACELYLEGGIRAVEVGSLLEGRDPGTRKNRRAKMELVRLAVPRRTYTESHLDFVAETFGEISERRKKIKGMEFVSETYPLRHFTSRFCPTTENR